MIYLTNTPMLRDELVPRHEISAFSDNSQISGLQKKTAENASDRKFPVIIRPRGARMVGPPDPRRQASRPSTKLHDISKIEHFSTFSAMYDPLPIIAPRLG
ncbi:hypothetical protein [Achromobacter sp. 2789STDY5608615]|uniref:hypothetical protein n=1 Tax=Achromobacter sp. 2789STDY5608615 TaxID=1806492 RepID=UPI0018D15331|nr:hypothetical protein [Achromobacter sp. 2789STDY5608615]